MTETEWKDAEPRFKKGDQPPASKADYLGWHEWADTQIASGLEQKECPSCGLWRFPQERCCV